jgi:hypothetical protein
VGQPVVDIHLVDINMSQSSTQAHYINENANTLENTDALILGNHEESNGIEEISITILVLEKCMIIVLQLSTPASQPSL